MFWNGDHFNVYRQDSNGMLPGLLAQQPKKVAVTLPMDERNTQLVDLNKDSKQDILMYHPSTTDSHRVTLLIAQ